jgi:Family of unknown function (DUF6283)
MDPGPGMNGSVNNRKASSDVSTTASLRWVRRNEDKPHRCPGCHAVATWDHRHAGPRTRLRCPRDCRVQWRYGARQQRTPYRLRALLAATPRPQEQAIPALPRRLYPCDECPIRADNQDNPRSQFPAARWEALSVTVRHPVTGSPGLDAPMFGCHKGAPGTDEDLACAGWLATFGADHVAVRVAVAQGRLPTEALSRGANWPLLHQSWDAVVEAQTARSQDAR